MGIQVHRTLVIQHAHALGRLKRLIRKNAPHIDILEQLLLLESLRRVIALQGQEVVWDEEHAVDARPHKRLLPRSAYTRDALNFMRRAECSPWSLIIPARTCISGSQTSRGADRVSGLKSRQSFLIRNSSLEALRPTR